MKSHSYRKYRPLALLILVVLTIVALFAVPAFAGKLTPTDNEQARRRVEQTFAASGLTAKKDFSGLVNVVVTGSFTGSVKIMSSFDGGTTPVQAIDTKTTAGRWQFTEPEQGVLYWADVTITSGSAGVRISN